MNRYKLWYTNVFLFITLQYMLTWEYQQTILSLWQWWAVEPHFLEVFLSKSHKLIATLCQKVSKNLQVKKDLQFKLMTVERFPLMSINYDVTKRGDLGKRASSDWLKVMSFMLKAKNTRINANLEIPLLGGLINFWRLSHFVLITL